MRTKPILKIIALPLKVKYKQRVRGCPQYKKLYKINIEEYPGLVNKHEKFSYWEINTVVGKKESDAVLLTLDEGMTRFRHII